MKRCRICKEPTKTTGWCDRCYSAIRGKEFFDACEIAADLAASASEDLNQLLVGEISRIREIVKLSGRLVSAVKIIFPWLEPKGKGYTNPLETPLPELSEAYNAYVRKTEEN